MKSGAGANEADLTPELYWTGRRRGGVVVILSLVAMFNFIDRQIVTILLEPIKQEFRVSDTMMGLFTGGAFAGLYAIASVPIARIADAHVRRTVIAVCLAFWSLMTTLGGFAQTFTQLALTRLGVAVGEAGSGPASHSILMDLYPPGRRGMVIGVLTATQALGIGLGVFLGGWLVDSFNWRTAMIMVGAPGLLLAILIRTMVREPPRGLSEEVKPPVIATPTLFVTLRRLWSMRSYRCAVASLAFGGIGGYGVLIWGPTFFLRVHHLSSGQVGLWFGALTATALVISALLGGGLSDWAGRRNLRGIMVVGGVGPLLAVPSGICFVLAGSVHVAFAAYFLMMAAQFQTTCVYTATQTLSPLRMRAMSSVVIGLVTNLAGMGLAPVLIGLSNDLLEPIVHAEALRYSLLGVVLIGFTGAGLAALASTIWFKADYDRLKVEAEEAGARPAPQGA